MFAPNRQDQPRLSPLRHPDQHGGGHADVPGKFGKIAFEQRRSRLLQKCITQAVREAHSDGIGARGKNRPPPQMPGGSLAFRKSNLRELIIDRAR